MRRIVWTRTAGRQLEELNRWYGEISPDLPMTLTERVETGIMKLLDFPLLGPAVPDSIYRKWRVRRTAYLVFYRPTADGILILKIRHDRSNWQGRD